VIRTVSDPKAIQAMEAHIVELEAIAADIENGRRK
jgi:hypothetical protein